MTAEHDAQRTWNAMRDMVEAAEAAGWDIGPNKGTLDRARDGLAALAFVLDIDTSAASPAPEVPS